MPIQSGDLDRRLTLLERVSRKGGRGAEVVDFVPVRKVWASKKDLSDGERRAADQVGVVVTTRFVVRWSSQTADLGSAWQLECQGVRYAIVGVKEVGRREGLEITAQALAGI